MRFEVNCAKSRHHVISDGLSNDLAKAKGKVPINKFFYFKQKKCNHYKEIYLELSP